MTDIPRLPEHDLWWSPSMGRFLTRHENSRGEHLVWLVQISHESLRHHLGTGPDSNPPMPADAVKLGYERALRDQIEAGNLREVKLRDELGRLLELFDRE